MSKEETATFRLREALGKGYDLNNYRREIGVLVPVVDAVRAIWWLRKSTDPSDPVIAIYLSPSDSLRRQAEGIEKKDAAIQALRDAIYHLERYDSENPEQGVQK